MNSVNETQSALTSNALSRILTCSAMVYSSATDRVMGMHQLEKANPYNDAAEMFSIGDYRLLGILCYGLELPGVSTEDLEFTNKGHINVADYHTKGYEEERLLTIIKLYAYDYNRTMIEYLRGQQALRQAGTLAGYNKLTNEFSIVSTDLGSYNLLPYSLVLTLRSMLGKQQTQVLWYNPCVGKTPHFTWNHFFPAYATLSKAIQDSKLVLHWMNSSTSNIVKTRIYATNDYIDYMVRSYITNDWAALELGSRPRYEIDLKQNGESKAKAFLGEDVNYIMLLDRDSANELCAGYDISLLNIRTNAKTESVAISVDVK